MIELLLEYGLFLAKLITIVAAVLFSIATIVTLRQKSKDNDGTLMVASLNEKYEAIRNDLQSETMDKDSFKKWTKEQKKAHKELKKHDKENPKNRLFVVNFEGDVRASHVDSLRQIVSAIVEVANTNDEVLVIIDSPGGMVHTYGLAASQLDRFRQHKLKLTVAVDKIAASGGYMMAVVGNHIIAAPFAIIGSIGVIGQLPNFHRFLDKHAIDYEQQWAGEYKRTLTVFGKNTDKGRQKFQEEIEITHHLFKQYIERHRPEIDINAVATGEHWHAIQAIDLKLVDEIQTSDDFILKKIKTMEVFEVYMHEKQRLSERIAHNVLAGIEKSLLRMGRQFGLARKT